MTYRLSLTKCPLGSPTRRLLERGRYTSIGGGSDAAYLRVYEFGRLAEYTAAGVGRARGPLSPHSRETGTGSAVVCGDKYPRALCDGAAGWLSKERFMPCARHPLGGFCRFRRWENLGRIFLDRLRSLWPFETPSSFWFPVVRKVPSRKKGGEAGR